MLQPWKKDNIKLLNVWLFGGAAPVIANALVHEAAAASTPCTKKYKKKKKQDKPSKGRKHRNGYTFAAMIVVWVAVIACIISLVLTGLLSVVRYNDKPLS